jgi:hypothetical protein
LLLFVRTRRVALANVKRLTLTMSPA